MLLLSVALHATAHACGGFACNANRVQKDQPPEVVQAAERVVFGLESDGRVEMHVQVAYEGPAEEFGWIVPVPEEPELFVSTSALFPSLARATEPLWDLAFQVEGRCRQPFRLPTLGCAEGPAFIGVEPPNPFSEPIPPVGIDILSETTVGPYQTVVLRALSVATLTDWLADGGFDVPIGFERAVTPYVAADAAFVALRLRKGFDAGDLAPLGMRWDADHATIPIMLTSIAAVPDMPLEVYVLGEHRAVPESYLHVQVNEAAVDWQTGGSNYSDVVRRAVDEAGGRAFVTDFVGSPDTWARTFDVSSYDGAALRQTDDPVDWTNRVLSWLPLQPTELATVIEAHIPLAPGVTPVDWLDGPDRHLLADPDATLDAETATLDLEAFVVEPLEAAHDLVGRHRVLTRLGSAISPDEMTTDPTFVLNPDLPGEIATRRRAALVTVCDRNVDIADAPLRLDLPDGRQLFSRPDLPLDDAHSQDAALVVEQMGREGLPEVLSDHRERLAELARGSERMVRACGGCGSVAPTPWGPALLAVAALGWVRRRRPRGPRRTAWTGSTVP